MAKQINTKDQANQMVRNLLQSGEKWLPNYGDPVFGEGETLIEFRRQPVVLDLQENLINIAGQEYQMDAATKQMAQSVFNKSEKRSLITLLIIAGVLVAFFYIYGATQKADKTIKKQQTQSVIRSFDKQRNTVAQFYSAHTK